ncbi:MAG: helix-turn-helix domain-containing protein [Pseudonocardiaceae bacterium]
MGVQGEQRRCPGCGTPLARDNRSRLCSPCSRREGQASGAPAKPDDFWRRAALRDGLGARHFGLVLSAYRHEHRPVLTQATVGRWLGLTQGQVSRLERTAQPTHDLTKLDQWARALHIPEHYLWFQLSPQPGSEDARPGARDADSLEHEPEAGGEAVKRRQLLQAAKAGAASVGGSAFGWFSAQPPSRSSTRAVGMTDVRIIREMTQTFRKLRDRFGGVHAYCAVTNYLAADVLPLLLGGRCHGDVRRELSAAVADLGLLAGSMAYDVGDDDSGRRHLQQAMRLCQGIGDDALAGEMLAAMSRQAAFLHFPALAIDLAQAAKDNGKKAGVPALVSESAVMEAQGLALMRDTSGCLAALHESEQAFTAAESRDRPEWLAYFDGDYLAGKFGRCFLDLGHPAEAERFARRSLDMRDGYGRVKLSNLTLLASALADQHKVEEACETGRQAVLVAHDVRSVRTAADLADLSRRLAPFRAESVVRMLDEQMKATGVLLQ